METQVERHSIDLLTIFSQSFNIFNFFNKLFVWLRPLTYEMKHFPPKPERFGQKDTFTDFHFPFDQLNHYDVIPTEKNELFCSKNWSENERKKKNKRTNKT